MSAPARPTRSGKATSYGAGLLELEADAGRTAPREDFVLSAPDPIRFPGATTS
jgi:hypothetical protein